MTMDKKYKIQSLLVRLLEDELTETDVETLNAWMKNDPRSIEVYCEFLTNYFVVQKTITDDIRFQECFNHIKPATASTPSLNNAFPESVAAETQDHSFDSNLWHDLEQMEQSAPIIEVLKEDLLEEPKRKIHYKPIPRKRNTFSLYTAVITAAAMLFMVLFVKFAPIKSNSMDVGTLVDQVNTKWSDTLALESGSRLWTNQGPYNLQQGTVQIEYDKGVEVFIEAPASFEIERSGIYLEFGRLYSIVSETGVGFRVETPTSQFIDLGTEFGVQSDIDGSSQLHVIKGKVQLFAGKNTNIKTGRIVTANNAVKFDAQNGSVRDIEVKKAFFVRQIDSKQNLQWRGETMVDLGDIVGGGDGFGTGKLFSALTINDQMADSSFSIETSREQRGKNYIIQSNPLIDSLFVPNAKTSICTQPDIRAEFPVTTGLTFRCVTNGGIVANQENGWSGTIWLGNKEYGQAGSPMLHLHSNTGITFDLQRIYQSNPNLTIDSFSSLCGIGEPYRQLSKDRSDARSKANPYIDFWVLVDGVIRFKKEKVSITSGPIPIDVKLQEGDRFLSLAVTESDGQTLFDWGIFAMPQLKFIDRTR